MRGTTTEPARLIDMPQPMRDRMVCTIRAYVVLREQLGRSDEEIVRRSVELHVEVAREEGHDEGDVEVIAAMARRMTAEALAGWRAYEECRRRCRDDG